MTERTGLPIDRAVWQDHFVDLPERVPLKPDEQQTPAMLVEEARIVNQLPSILRRIRPHVQEGIRGGFIPPEAAARIETAFMHTPVKVVGSLATGNATTVHAEYDADRDVALIAPGLGKRLAIEVTVHELAGHQASGGTFTRDKKTGAPVRTRNGFHGPRELNLSDTFHEHTAVDEAMAAHLEQSYLYGNFATIDPDRRWTWGAPQRYYTRRKVLADVIGKARGIIDPRVVMRAWFEDTSQVGVESTDRREMMRQFSAAYGPGSLRHVASFIEQAEANCGDNASRKEKALLLRQLTCIKPPVLGAQGIL